jgi:hypothetical protein
LGHSPLNNYLHKIRKIDSPNCSKCKTIEDVQHYLVNCSRFTSQRKEFRRILKREKINININSTKDLLDSPEVLPFLATFILSTKRFENLNTYKEDQEE